MEKFFHTKFRIVWKDGVDPLTSGTVSGELERFLENHADLLHTAPKIVHKSDAETREMETTIILVWSNSTTAGQQDDLVNKVTVLLAGHVDVIQHLPDPVGYHDIVDYSVPQ